MKALVVKKPGFLEVMDVEEPTMYSGSVVKTKI